MTAAEFLIGTNYWYGSNSLPDALEGLSQEGSFPRTMRRASEAVVQEGGFQRYAQLFLALFVGGNRVPPLVMLFLVPIGATLSPIFGQTVPTNRATYQPRTNALRLHPPPCHPVFGQHRIFRLEHPIRLC
jgi:hypothetical protein